MLPVYTGMIFYTKIFWNSVGGITNQNNYIFIKEAVSRDFFYLYFFAKYFCRGP
jgi:hypothetical protein